LRNSQFLEGLPAISYLPAEEWNCGDFQLHQFSDSTRIVHLTGMLRNAVFGRPIPKSIADQAGTIIEKFNQYACAVA
jgi:hypothetical protein